MSELEFLEHYNKKILKHGDNQEVLLKSLGKLDQVRVTIDLLAQTGVGKTVSALKKKYGDSEIGTLSRDLVAKWKASVAKEEEDRENEESEEVVENGNDDPMLPSSEYSVPEYVPSRISTVEANKANSADENIREKGDDEEQYSRKSKKKKSHRERSEDRESNRSDKTHKHKKDKEREKKQKHSEREKDKESRSSSSSSKDKDHKRKSSHRDRHRENDVKTKESRQDKKCDINEASDQGDRNKHKTDNARHGIHGNQGELKHKSEEKHSRSKHNDLSSFDMFSKPSLEHKEEKASSRKSWRRRTRRIPWRIF